MLQVLEAYRADRLTLAEFVSDLHGAMEAGDFQEEGLQGAFYDAWIPLETVLALRGDGVPYSQVSDEIREMQRFLLENQWSS